MSVHNKKLIHETMPLSSVSDSLFWEEPTKYPAAMLIISRECTSCGYCIDGKYVSDMFKAAQIITDAFYKTEM